jgi:dihydroflavonol-4-reductase
VLSRGGGDELAALGVERVDGDVVRDPVGMTPLASALDGCRSVFHLAGFVSRDPADGQRMMRVHVDGTRRLLQAAARAGVERVVLASTSGTIAVSKEPAPIPDERADYPMELVAGWPYYLSKIYQEKLALSLGALLGLEVVVVNPSLLLGPGDVRDSSTGEVKQLLRGRVPFVPSGGLSFVDARDAARATVAAMERGRPGERYLLGGANWTFERFFQRAARIAKISPPRLRVPDGVGRRAAWVLEHAFRALDRPAPVDPIAVEMSQVYWYCASDKAAAELGFVPRDPAETLDDTIRDLRTRLI